MNLTKSDSVPATTETPRASLAVILAFYAYVVVIGLAVATINPLNLFGDWSTRQFSLETDPVGRSYTNTRFAIWESLSTGEKSTVVVALAIILTVLPILSYRLARKGWRNTTASFLYCAVGVVALFALLGVSYLQYMAMSCLSDAWLHLGKMASVGTWAALPILAFKRLRDM